MTDTKKDLISGKDFKYRYYIEYIAWVEMKRRCYTKSNKRYHRYGGRGIKVCSEWKDNFPQFYHDMGKRPGKKYSLGRIDNNKNYTKKNCRWELISNQANNRSNNHRVTFNGETLTLAQWERKLGFPKMILAKRFYRNWDIERALTQKPRIAKKR